MSCTLPIKSFLLCLSLTSSPINREECPLSLRRYLFVSPLHHPLGPPLSVSHLDALILYFWLFSLFCFFSISPSLSLSLSLLIGKRCCVMHILNQQERERKSAAGALIQWADSWLLGLLLSIVGPLPRTHCCLALSAWVDPYWLSVVFKPLAHKPFRGLFVQLYRVQFAGYVRNTFVSGNFLGNDLELCFILPMCIIRSQQICISVQMLAWLGSVAFPHCCSV